MPAALNNSIKSNSTALAPAKIKHGNRKREALDLLRSDDNADIPQSPNEQYQRPVTRPDVSDGPDEQSRNLDESEPPVAATNHASDQSHEEVFVTAYPVTTREAARRMKNHIPPVVACP